MSSLEPYRDPSSRPTWDAPRPLEPVELDPRPARGVVLPRAGSASLYELDDLAPMRRRHEAAVTGRHGATVALGYQPAPAVHEYAPHALKRLLGSVSLVARCAAGASLCAVVVVVCWLLIGVIL